MDVQRKNIGLTDYEGIWHLRVWAPDASEVSLQLGSGDRLLQLTPLEHGYWALITADINAGDSYWLNIDGEQLPDPAAISLPEGVHGPSQALSLDFNWSDAEWKNMPLKDYIFYELHTGTFSPQGNFEGIAEKLDYLLDLGITAIEIMPLASFPGKRNWGYDGVFPFAVQSSYGGPRALQHLVNLCHSKGLAVVLDVVYNHLGPEGNYLSEFGPYFTGKYATPWGNAVNFDDRGAHGVREYFIENALMWFRDFHVDALRLDAVHAIKDFSAVHILQEIRKQTDLLSACTGRDYHLIAECDLNDPRYITDPAHNGLGMHAQWIDEFHHALRVSAGEPRKGYYADFKGVAHLCKSFHDAYVYTGEYSMERDNYFGKSPNGHPGSQFVVFSQNHDQIGNRMLGERSSVLYSFEMQKLMAAAVIFAPFLPMLFMGEEWAETSPFLYFIDHTDPDLVEQVREGRRKEFAAMHHSGQAPDPKDEQTFMQSKLNWDLLQSPKNAVMRSYYKQLIALRKKHPALQNDNLAQLSTQLFESQNCLMVERKTPDAELILLGVMNFSPAMQQLPLPAGLAIEKTIINSAGHQWLGLAGDIAPGAAELEAASLTLQPESFALYSAYYV